MSILPRSLTAASCLLCIAGSSTATVTAQVPYRFLMLSENGAGSPTHSNMRFIDPETGVATPVVANFSGPVLRKLAAIALDPNDPQTVYAGAIPGATTGVNWQVLPITGSVLFSNTTQKATGYEGTVGRYAIYGNEILILYARGKGSDPAGLYSVLTSGGTLRQLFALPDVEDMEVIGNNVYCNTFVAGMPSTLVEYNMLSGILRTVGTNIPTIRSIAPYPGGLIGGSNNGDFYAINVTTGFSNRLFSLPAMGAIRNMTASGTDYAFYFTNSQSELYKFPNVTTPIYVAGGTITDLKFGLWDQASALVYGTGCAGSSGTTPSCVPSGLPTIGNSSFSLDVQDAPASAPGTLLLGTNRQVFGGQQLPFSLDAIGMMGCTLETDVLLTLGVTADAAGMASVGVPIPLFQWKGGRFTAQYFFLDAAANNLGVISSDAVEGIVR